MLLPLHKHIQYDLDVSFFKKTEVAQTVQNYSPVFNSMAVGTVITKILK